MARRQHALCGIWWAFAAAVAVPASAAGVAEHDIHFVSEHAAESGMDASYLALPWPGGMLDAGRWSWSVDWAATRTRTEFIRLGGPTVAVAAFKGRQGRWGLGLLGSYSDLSVEVDAGEAGLTRGGLDSIPLALPARAAYTGSDGAMRHAAAGAVAVRELPGRRAKVETQVMLGALLERLALDHYGFDFVLLTGANAGAAGVVDHSLEATFVTPLVGWQQRRSLSRRWTWSPRVLAVYPLPPADFDLRLAGTGFERNTPDDGRGSEIGDPFVAVGLGLTHRPSGLEIDVGSTLLFPRLEQQSHAGVDRAWIVHLAWRQSRTRER